MIFPSPGGLGASGREITLIFPSGGRPALRHNPRVAGGLGAGMSSDWLEMPEAAVFDLGRRRLLLSPRRQRLASGLLLWPVCQELADARVLPREGLVAAEGRLAVEGLAVNATFVRRGLYPAVQPAGEGRFRVHLPPAAVTVAEPVLLAGGDVTGNYYHWLLDVLPRLAACARHGAELLGGAPLRLALAAPRPDFAGALLALAGLDGAEIITLDAERPQCFRRLLVFSNLTQYGFVHPAALDYLPPPPPGPGRRRLYVSRGDATTRRLDNERQVLEALAPLGVEPVMLAGVGLERQRALFAEAELVIGPHGAGLANLLWTPAGCALLELRPQVAALWQYERLCAALGRRHAVVAAPPQYCRRPGDPNSSFVLPPAPVAAAVAGLLG